MVARQSKQQQGATKRITVVLDEEEMSIVNSLLELNKIRFKSLGIITRSNYSHGSVVKQIIRLHGETRKTIKDYEKEVSE